MSEMFIMPDRGAFAGQFAEATQRAATQHWAVPLKRTDEPVSLQDERIEDQALEVRGEPLPVAADSSFADEVLGEVTFGLPERLRAEDLTRAVTGASKTAAWDYVGFRMMPTFAGPRGHLLWRLKLSIKLFIPGKPDPQAAETSAALATAVYLEPQNILGKQLMLSGEIGIDLGEVAKLFPPLQALKMQATIPFQARKYRPVIRLSGMDKHIFSWFVADPDLTSVFRPTVVAQLPAAYPLAIEAKLHVEIRKTVLGIPHKVYAISDPGVSLNYLRALRADTFVAINPKVPPSRRQAILLGKNPVEPPPPAPPAGSVSVRGVLQGPPGAHVGLSELDAVFGAELGNAIMRAESGEPKQAGWSRETNYTLKVERITARPSQPGTGAVSDSPTAPQTQASPEVGSDPTIRLRKLQELRDAGLLSQEEYELKRTEVIDSI